MYAYHLSSDGCIVLSSVCHFVCLFVHLSVNTITPELLEISSQNFQGIILGSKRQMNSAVWGYTEQCIGPIGLLDHYQGIVLLSDYPNHNPNP